MSGAVESVATVCAICDATNSLHLFWKLVGIHVLHNCESQYGVLRWRVNKLVFNCIFVFQSTTRNTSTNGDHFIISSYHFNYIASGTTVELFLDKYGFFLYRFKDQEPLYKTCVCTDLILNCANAKIHANVVHTFPWQWVGVLQVFARDSLCAVNKAEIWHLSSLHNFTIICDLYIYLLEERRTHVFCVYAHFLNHMLAHLRNDRESKCRTDYATFYKWGPTTLKLWKNHVIKVIIIQGDDFTNVYWIKLPHQQYHCLHCHQFIQVNNQLHSLNKTWELREKIF